MQNTSNNLFAGKVLLRLEEVNSTNEFAKELLSKSKPEEGTAIVAGFQTAGKGQIGKTWRSARGENLTFSLIFYPTFLLARQAFLLNEAVCLALKDFLGEMSISARIKWPNDIYYGEKKLAGILIENVLQGEYLSSAVIGIGMNVNQSEFGPDVPNPVSLRLITGQPHELNRALHGLFPFLERRYLQIKSGGSEAIRSSFNTALYGLHEKRFFLSEGIKFEGIIRGVDENGRLLVETNGSLTKWNNGEIGYL